MRFKILLFSVLLSSLSACQHRERSTIGYDQLMMYTTHQATQGQWASKARRQSLGGVVPPPSYAQPLFGYKFVDAKDKVRILDIRSPEEFQKKNLTMTEGQTSPVVNIPAAQILNAVNMESLLNPYNINQSSIILVIASDLKESKGALERLKKDGYTQTLYYENAYP